MDHLWSVPPKEDLARQAWRSPYPVQSYGDLLKKIKYSAFYISDTQYVLNEYEWRCFEMIKNTSKKAGNQGASWVHLFHHLAIVYEMYIRYDKYQCVWCEEHKTEADKITDLENFGLMKYNNK